MTVSDLNGLITYLLFFYLLEFIVGTFGHGRLIDPPARGTMWRLGFDSPPNYNDHELFCGGFAHQWEQNKGRCGECGDPWDLPRPRPNESGGTFGTGIISRVYRKGEAITVTVHLTANHLGWFEFRLCENDEPKQFVKQSCLNKNVLKLVDHPGTRFEVKENGTGLFRIKMKLPDDVTCNNCVLQWHYTSGNNWGFCQDGRNKPGCGPQEVFRGCSDIAIFARDDPDYFKYENLMRKIDFENYFMFDGKTGHYDADENQEDSDGKSHKEKVPTVQTMSEQSREEGDEKQSEFGRRNLNDKRRPKDKKQRQNGRKNVNFLWKNDRASKQEKISKTEDENFDLLVKKYRNPNYFSEKNQNSDSPPGKYISSDTFRRILDSSSSKVRESKSVVPSRKLRLGHLSSLINRPKIPAESSEMYDEMLERKRLIFVSTTPIPVNNLNRYLTFSTVTPNSRSRNQDQKRIQKPFARNREDHSKSNSENTVVKFSEVLSLLLNLTASSPSSSEANNLLDNVAKTLSAVLSQKRSSSEKKRKERTPKLFQNKRVAKALHRPTSANGFALLSPTYKIASHPSPTSPLPLSLLISPSVPTSPMTRFVSSSTTPVPLSDQTVSLPSPLSVVRAHVREGMTPTDTMNKYTDLKSLINAMTLQQIRSLLQYNRQAENTQRLQVALSTMAKGPALVNLPQTSVSTGGNRNF